MGAIVKDAVTTEVTPAKPATPAAAAIAIEVYAPPLPVGRAYHQAPSAAAWPQWVPSYQVRVPQTTPTVTSVFVPVPPGGGGISYDPATQTITPQYASGALTGWWVTTTTTATVYVNDTVNYYANPANVHTITFPDSAKASNGYPLGPNGSTHRGLLTIGGASYSIRFTKDANGYMKNLDPFPAIAYGSPRPAYGIFARIAVPAVPFVPGTPAVVNVDDRAGWNAGAQSIGVLNGDVHCVFQPAVAVAGAIGFLRDAANPVPVASVSHGFYFDNDPATGDKRFSIIENGVRKSAPDSYTTATDFELRRVGAGVVTYKYNGATIYTSIIPLFGATAIGTTLFRAGDGVL